MLSILAFSSSLTIGQGQDINCRLEMFKNEGYRSDPVHYFLRIDNEGAEARRLVFLNKRPNFDRFTLKINGQKTELGRELSYSARVNASGVDYRGFAFPFVAPAKSSTITEITLQTQTRFYPDFWLLDYSQALLLVEKDKAVSIIAHTILIIVFVLSLLFVSLFWDWKTCLLSSYLISSALFFWGWMGLGYTSLWGDWPTLNQRLPPALMALSEAILCVLVLLSLGVSRKSSWFFFVSFLSLMWGVLVLCSLVCYKPWVFEAISIMVTTTMLSLIAVAFAFKEKINHHYVPFIISFCLEAFRAIVVRVPFLRNSPIAETLIIVHTSEIRFIVECLGVFVLGLIRIKTSIPSEKVRLADHHVRSGILRLCEVLDGSHDVQTKENVQSAIELITKGKVESDRLLVGTDHFSRLDLDALIGSTLPDLQLLGLKVHANIKSQCLANLQKLWLKTVLIDLGANSKAACASAVEIMVYPVIGGALISFKDNGPGFEPKKIRKGRLRRPLGSGTVDLLRFADEHRGECFFSNLSKGGAHVQIFLPAQVSEIKLFTYIDDDPFWTSKAKKLANEIGKEALNFDRMDDNWFGIQKLNRQVPILMDWIKECGESSYNEAKMLKKEGFKVTIITAGDVKSVPFESVFNKISFNRVIRGL